jgi:acetyl esterase/lipase
MMTQSTLLWPQGAPGAKGTGPEDCPRLTPYLPEGAGPFPAVVVCPGGAYAFRAAHEAEPIARWLSTLGVAGLVLDYRVAPYKHPVPLGDAQRAIRMTRARCAEFRVDPKRVGILGFSAGGHLAVSAATIFDAGQAGAADPIDRQSCRPDALIACYAVVTLTGPFAEQGSMTNLVGDPANATLREYLSLENRVTQQTPPTFIWHTSDDACVPVENALLLASALRRHAVPFAMHVFQHGSHGLGLAKESPDVAAWTQLCGRWLGEIGFVK